MITTVATVTGYVLLAMIRVAWRIARAR